jgi:hypothetical protein
MGTFTNTTLPKTIPGVGPVILHLEIFQKQSVISKKLKKCWLQHYL